MIGRISCLTTYKGCVATKNKTKKYEEHPKHILPMTQIELFNKFKEEHKEVKLFINTIVHKNHGLLDPSLFVTLVVIIMWNLSCITTLFWILVKLYGQVHLLLPHSVFLYLKFYVKEKMMIYFTKKMCWWKEMWSLWKSKFVSFKVSYWYEWSIIF